MKQAKILKVQMLGGFSVSYGDVLVTEASKRSQSVWKLFKFLVANRKKLLPVEDFLDLLWPDEDIANPAKALQNLVYRLRSLIAKSGATPEYILFNNGGYSWNPAAPCVIDLQEFEDAYLAARALGIDDDERARGCEKAIALYTGDFLPDSTFEEWTLSFVSYYKRIYMECVYSLLQWCEKKEDNERVLLVCEKALQIDNYDEHLHACYVSALHKTNKTGQAIAHYERVIAMLKRELGVSPSAELKKAYHGIYDESLHINMSLDEISSGLGEASIREAFYCDYDVFKHLYRLEVRTAERSGQAVFIGLLTALNTRHEVPADEILLPAVTLLKDVCLEQLRKGDVVTKFSKSQIALLLPTLTVELGDQVMGRIIKAFHKQYRGIPVIINAKIRPLDMNL